MCVQREGCFKMRRSSGSSMQRLRAVLPLMLAGATAGLPLCTRGEKPVSFNEQIRPLLNAHCVKCHGGVKETGKLNLLFRDAALKGGNSGLPAVVPGKPEASELIARLTTDD